MTKPIGPKNSAKSKAAKKKEGHSIPENRGGERAGAGRKPLPKTLAKKAKQAEELEKTEQQASRFQAWHRGGRSAGGTESRAAQRRPAHQHCVRRFFGPARAR